MGSSPPKAAASAVSGPGVKIVPVPTELIPKLPIHATMLPPAPAAASNRPLAASVSPPPVAATPAAPPPVVNNIALAGNNKDEMPAMTTMVMPMETVVPGRNGDNDQETVVVTGGGGDDVVLVDDIDAPVVGEAVAQSANEGGGMQKQQFSLATRVTLEIIGSSCAQKSPEFMPYKLTQPTTKIVGVAVGVLGIGLLVWYVKRSRRRNRPATTRPSEKGVRNVPPRGGLGPPAAAPASNKPPRQSDLRKTFSSVAATFKGAVPTGSITADSTRSNGAGSSSRFTRFSARRSSRWRSSNEPAELPDISTCPYAYADRAGVYREDDIPIGIQQAPTQVGFSLEDETLQQAPPPALAPARGRQSFQATSSTSVMIMYVQDWMPGGGGGGDSISSGSSSINNNYNNNENGSDAGLGWEQQREQQQRQTQYADFSPMNETIDVPPLAWYGDKRSSMASTVSSAYTDFVPDEDDATMMGGYNGTATRISAPRIPYPATHDRFNYF